MHAWTLTLDVKLTCKQLAYALLLLNFILVFIAIIIIISCFDNFVAALWNSEGLHIIRLYRKFLVER